MHTIPTKLPSPGEPNTGNLLKEVFERIERAEHFGNVETPAPDDAAMLEFVLEYVRSAKELDKAMESVLTAITRYVANSRKCTATRRRLLVERHGEEAARPHDADLFSIPIIGAVALTSSVKQMANVFDDSALDEYLQVNAYTPLSPNNFTDAAINNTITLAIYL